MAKSSKKRYNIDGMELSAPLYKEYKSIPKNMKAQWKSRYKDKTAPPFTEIYDSRGDLQRSIVKKVSKK